MTLLPVFVLVGSMFESLRPSTFRTGGDSVGPNRSIAMSLDRLLVDLKAHLARNVQRFSRCVKALSNTSSR